MKLIVGITQNKVNIAISQMLKDNIPVNFNSVSRHSGVSKRFLYSNPDSKEIISNLRSQGNSNKLPRTRDSLNESSKDVIINKALTKKILSYVRNYKYFMGNCLYIKLSR